MCAVGTLGRGSIVSQIIGNYRAGIRGGKKSAFALTGFVLYAVLSFLLYRGGTVGGRFPMRILHIAQKDGSDRQCLPRPGTFHCQEPGGAYEREVRDLSGRRPVQDNHHISRETRTAGKIWRNDIHCASCILKKRKFGKLPIGCIFLEMITKTLFNLCLIELW